MKRIILKVINAIQKYIWFCFKWFSSVNARLRIKNKDFTLLTSTCIGGVIYNRLGLKFLSPTIDLWIRQPDFLKFCTELDYYLNQPLSFYEEPSRKGQCPCAHLGIGEKQISIHFVHYKTEYEAKNSWERRKARINRDNLYILTSDGNGAVSSDFEKLDSVVCKRKIIFTSRKCDEIKDSFELKTLNDEKSAAVHMIKQNKITGLYTWEHEFDYVAWLNNEEYFRLNV